MAREHKLPNGQVVSLHDIADIDVYLAQMKLNELGAKPRLAEDGLYGPHTGRALDRSHKSVIELANMKRKELEKDGN